MQNSNKLSVIIVNYASKHYLIACIASIYDKIGCDNLEIIVVNNDCREDLGFLSQYQNLTVVNLANNVGFGTANNIGVKKATGKYILFLNPDTIIDTANIKAVFEEMEQDCQLGMVGAKVLDINKNIQKWSFGQEEVNLRSLIMANLPIFKNKQPIFDNKKELAWVSGVAFIMSKQLFLQIDGFDEKIFLYYEDVDLCKRVKKQGKKIKVSSEIVITHFGSGSHNDKNKQKMDYFLAQDYYFKKHFGLIIYVIVKILRKIFA
jgi:GT2 family glycosyltransferase